MKRTFITMKNHLDVKILIQLKTRFFTLLLNSAGKNNFIKQNSYELQSYLRDQSGVILLSHVSFTVTGGNGAFVGDYFEHRINTHLVSGEYLWQVLSSEILDCMANRWDLGRHSPPEMH